MQRPENVSLPFEKCGRVKRIFWDNRGLAYYRRGNMRTYLDTVERLTYPYFYEDEQGKDVTISGWEYIGAYSPLYVEILEDGEVSSYGKRYKYE